MELPVLTARGLNRAYRGDGTVHHAVCDASLEVAHGEFVLLMGPSGCGKSTLLNLLGGMDRPDGGEVWWAGQRIDQLTETRLAIFRRRHIGIVFQFFHLIHNLNAEANIELPGLLAGLSSAQVRRRTLELMRSLGIAELGRKMPGQLSGGQRQRVAMARALVNRPSLLLADEPTGALDLENGLAVMQLLAQLHSEGQSILMVTHDPKMADYAGRVLMMQDGRVSNERTILS